MESEDYYEILQVDPSATSKEIKKAYQELARKFHPDKQGQGSEEKFQEIDRAYKTLRDPELRRIYDSELMQNTEHLIIHEVVNRREFERDEDVNKHRCKCGSNYTLDNDEFNDKNEIILSCEECSLNIRVT